MSKTIEDKAYSYLLKIRKEERLTGIKTNHTDSFIAGYELCEKEYEEKLRWIPISEKMPENLEWVDCKSGVGDHYVGCYLENYGIKTGEPATITHWRSFL